MPGPLTKLSAAYCRAVLLWPRATLAVLLGVAAFFAYHAKDFSLDASADSLLLENDADLQLFRQVSARYQTGEVLIVTFTSEANLFSDSSLAGLGELRDALREPKSVASVISILDAPLVKSSDVPLLEMAGNVQTLETPGIDRERARRELSESPVYRDLIISRDHRTTALLLNLKPHPGFAELLTARNELLIKRGAGPLDPEEARRLEEVTAAYSQARDSASATQHATILEVRAVIDAHRHLAELHLGGGPMIADDMVTFVRNDLVVFGSSVLLFLVVILSAIFRRVRWVVLPLLSCTYASVVMIGMLGLIGWEVTVISSNFLALMLIITISMNIHLAVRYRQLLQDMPDAGQVDLVETTLRRMVWPCLYTSLTTIIGFSSLVFSDIKPVQDFGWMMSAGLMVAFLTSFSLFPAVLVLFERREERASPAGLPLTAELAGLTERHGNAILVTAAVVALVGGFGISRLTVENSFIDYFRSDTEIYQGMKLIDDELGGTTPLQVLLNLDPDRGLPDVAAGSEEDEPLEDEDDFGDWDIDVAAGPAYWFTPYKIDRVKEVHDYLDSLPEVGKVLSLASIIRVAEYLNDGEELEGVALSVLYQKVPREVREPLIDPYFSFEHNEARIVLRILDSKPGLRRKELLERIRTDLAERFQLTERDVTLTGALVLYNNMLQSLYSSQISSIGAVLVGITLMFLLLFRSLRLAVIGIVPNLLAAVLVLGLMGLVGIPLDMMTITIAAITIGIAVDNGIHYIYRFREEFAATGDYVETLRICHANIGRAVLYTSATVIVGFSILVLSNFLPTVYFGVLTGLAMGVALLAALTLLPRLILVWRPFG